MMHNKGITYERPCRTVPEEMRDLVRYNMDFSLANTVEPEE